MPDSIPHAEPVLASLVVESLSCCKFFLSVISNLIVDLCINPSRASARRFHHTVSTLDEILLFVPQSAFPAKMAVLHQVEKPRNM